jgi:hypothetical protein
MATKKKKKAAPKAKKAAPKKQQHPQILVDFLGLDEGEEVTPLALAAAHQALWGANSRSLSEEKVLVEIQKVRGQRRP